MDTTELVYSMTDGCTSINAIESLLRQCGHDHDVIMEAICQIAESPDYTHRTIRAPHTILVNDEPVEVLLDELVFVPIK